MLRWFLNRMRARGREPAQPRMHGSADEAFRAGNRLASQDRFAEAVACYREALALRPAFAEAYCNLGTALKDLGRIQDAIPCFLEALRLQPRMAEAYFNLGAAWQGLGEFAKALPCYREAVRLEPRSAASQFALGYLYANEDRRTEALRCFAETLRQDPEHVEARWGQAMAQLLAVCGPDDAPERGRAAFASELLELDQWFTAARCERSVNAVGSMTPFRLAYQEEDNRELLERHGRLCARILARRAVPGPSLAPRRRDAGGALRVAVVSRYFHSHSVWNAMVKGWFRHLDPARFELMAFCLGAEEDRETLMARAHAVHYAPGPRPLAQWVQAIADEHPDVLIYPEVGMDPMAQRLASLRLAPVQAAAWGHPETTGLPTIDYYLSAADFEAPEADAYYSETLVRLPNLGCHVSPSVEPGPAMRAEALGLDAARPLLICPGTPFKYPPEHDAAIIRIAARLESAQFVFFTYRMEELSRRLQRRLEAGFARAGLDPGRHVRFVPWQSQAAFHGLLRTADACLDTIGFSGFNTALQVLECGLPLVTREGRFMRGRFASAILRRLEIPELIAPDVDAYVAIAARLIEEPGFARDVRRRIADRCATLHHDSAPIRALEQFLLDAAGASHR